MVVNIEVKNLPTEAGFDPDDRVSPLAVVDLVESSGRTGSVIVSSFWSGALRSRRCERPCRCRDRPPGGSLLRPFRQHRRCARDRLCGRPPPSSGWSGPATVGAAHDAGLAVAAWTVNDRPGLELARSAGVDTVVTDDVPLARRTVDEV